MLRRKLRSGVIRILRFAMLWLSFAARKWFSAAVTIAGRCDGRAWNVRHTKFPNPMRVCPPITTCHFFVQIEIDGPPHRQSTICADEERQSKRRADVQSSRKDTH